MRRGEAWMRQTAVAMLMVGPPLAAAAQDAVELALQSTPFYDVVHERATIGGARVVGFVAASPPAGGGEPRVEAWVPPEWAGGELCLRAMSADGLYESYNTYDVPAGWAGGLARLPYPSGYPDLVAELTSREEVAASVRAGACDKPADGGETALALWNAGPEAPALLLVNSFRADEAFLFPEDGPSVTCSPLSEARARVAFDMACEVPAGAFRDGVARLDLVTVKDGAMGDEAEVVLRRGP